MPHSGSTPPLDLPQEVIDHIRAVFLAVNRRVSNRICAMPTAHEQQLDMAFIEGVAQHGSAVRVAADWMVRIETHFLGGMRHWRSWEIADIGVLVMLRRGGRLTVTKAAVLQSKRLYPDEQDLQEDEPSDYQIGFARLFRDEIGPANLVTRRFGLTKESYYRALSIPGEQFDRIAAYSKQRSTPVYYLFYNPSVLPWSIELPAEPDRAMPSEVRVGARVVPFSALRSAFGKSKASKSPRFADLVARLPRPFAAAANRGGWRLESVVADEVLGCREGYRTTNLTDHELESLFYRRTGPIAAAFAITIDGPAPP